MTVKLYETDSYIKDFEATVLSCDEADGAFAVVLDRTAFFPEGGGQDPDTGTLGGAAVTDVQIKDGIVVHTVGAALAEGETVRGEIDWELRFSRMQSHAGEHLVSGIIHAMFGYSNVGFHMSDTVVTLDTDGVLTAQDIETIEQEANRAIWKNKAITAFYPSAQELKTTAYRSKIDFEEGVRLVTIEDYDCCACCAPHPARTGEIGLIKIVDHYPNKGGTRIEMLSGVHAFEDYRMLHTANKAMMRLLSAKRAEIAQKVEKDHEALGAVRAENKLLSERLTLAQLETAVLGSFVCGFAGAVTFDELRYCANSLCADGCVLFAQNDDGWLYVVSSEQTDTRPIVKALNDTFGGRGGGKPNYAQGKIAAASKDELTAFVKSIVK